MGTLVGSNTITRYLLMRGDKRLSVKDDITRFIVDYKSRTFSLRFLESRNYTGENDEPWIEYNILLEVKKIAESGKYLGEVMKEIGKYISQLSTNFSGLQIGIQNVETTREESYYILIYIIKDYVEYN